MLVSLNVLFLCSVDVNSSKMVNICRQLRDENLALKEKNNELKEKLEGMTTVHDAAQYDVDSLRAGMKVRGR